MKRDRKDRLRDRQWDLIARAGCKLGRYTKCSDSAGRYYYVRGPLLPLARFAVIGEHLEHEPDQWVKDWMNGKPTAVLWFSFWKLKLRTHSKASFAEADWYRGFVEVDRQRR